MNIGINDKLDILISLAAKDCGNDDVVMFDSLDKSRAFLDKRFYIKLRQIVNRKKHAPTIIVLKKCLVRVAVALMALMSLGFLTIMATPDLRDALFEAVVEWYDNYVSIRYEPIKDDTYEPDITEESTDVSLTKSPEEESSVPVIVAPPTKIEIVMKPTYIPEGLEEELIVSNISTVVIDYYDGNDLCYTYNQILFRDNKKLLDNETIQIANTIINGYAASIVEHKNQNEKAIIWTDGLYYYQIITYSSKISVEQLIIIASSVH